MAKPAAELPDRAALQALITASGTLAVRVTPGADRDALMIKDAKLLARVRAIPEAGEANAAVMALVAKALGVPRASVALLRGVSAREKLLRIEA